MRQLTAILTILTLLLATSRVEAQDTEFTLWRLPEPTVVGQNERFVYNLGQFQELLRMDADLHAAEETIALMREESAEQDRVIAALQEAHELANRQVEELQQERSRLRIQWEEENLRRHQAENAPDIGEMIGWGIAAVAGVVALALGATLAVTSQ